MPRRYGQCKQTAQEILNLVEECNDYSVSANGGAN